MGVPVPERFFTEYSFNNAFLLADKSILADIGTSNSDFPNASVVADFKFPSSGKVAVYADGFKPDDAFNSTTYLQSNNGRITNKTYDGKTFAREMFSVQNVMFRVTTAVFRDYKSIGDGAYFTCYAMG